MQKSLSNLKKLSNKESLNKYHLNFIDSSFGGWKIDENTTMVHKGISHRSFKRSFTLSDEMKVKGAKMENGMLYIALERIVPDHKKPQTIEVK